MAGNEAWIKESSDRIAAYKKELEKWTSVPPFEHMMEEEWNYYFPGTYKDSKIEGHYCKGPPFAFHSSHGKRLKTTTWTRPGWTSGCSSTSGTTTSAWPPGRSTRA